MEAKQTTEVESRCVLFCDGEITVDQNSGSYAVRYFPAGWEYCGNFSGSVTHIQILTGTDVVGPYRQVMVRCGSGGDEIEYALQAYSLAPVVRLGWKTKGSGKVKVCFPDFRRLPKGLRHFSYGDDLFAPYAFGLRSGATPWMSFNNQGQSFIISASTNFMIADMKGDGITRLGSGLNEKLNGLEAEFKHDSLLVFGAGINATWDRWGEILVALKGRHIPTSDADIVLRNLGFWTDHGGWYYYNYNQELGYQQTLLNLKDHWNRAGIPISYMQLDSWWYYKSFTAPDGSLGVAKNLSLPDQEWNRYGGLLKYEAHPDVLPDGLSGFSKRVGLPLVVHSRWVDKESPYQREFRFTGGAAIDPKWWENIMRSIAESGVICYEQDWLNEIYYSFEELQTDPKLGQMFMDLMAESAQRHKLSLQYCMPLPRHYLQGMLYDNLTSIRASHDRFERRKWTDFLYTSRFATAVGIWPWADTCMSCEPDNLLLATLSCGPVGIGDQMGTESRSNLLRAVRADGAIIKPDRPLLPLDEIYHSDSCGDRCPMVASTFSNHQIGRTVYAVVYNRGRRYRGEIKFNTLGLNGMIVVRDLLMDRISIMSADTPMFFKTEDERAYLFQATGFGRNGIAFLGDATAYASNGRQRIRSVSEIGEQIKVEVIFAVNESQVLLLCVSPNPMQATDQMGHSLVVKSDALTQTHWIEVVSPNPKDTGNIPPGDEPNIRTISLEAEIPKNQL